MNSESILHVGANWHWLGFPKAHSSLESVGLTAAVSSKLAERGISANVIAAYYHDHIFVQAEKADAALSALNEFSR